MKRSYLVTIIFACLLFCSCFNGDYNEQERRIEEKYNEAITKVAKSQVDSFLISDAVPTEKIAFKIKGGIYCMWKQRKTRIHPHSELNSMLIDGGYEITLSKDSLRYIVITETRSHDVGTYTNGATATTIETIMSLIDLNSKKTYLLARVEGGAPPNSVRSRNLKVAIGSTLSTEGMYRLLSEKLEK